MGLGERPIAASEQEIRDFFLVVQSVADIALQGESSSSSPTGRPQRKHEVVSSNEFSFGKVVTLLSGRDVLLLVQGIQLHENKNEIVCL